MPGERGTPASSLFRTIILHGYITHVSFATCLVGHRGHGGVGAVLGIVSAMRDVAGAHVPGGPQSAVRLLLSLAALRAWEIVCGLIFSLVDDIGHIDGSAFSLAGVRSSRSPGRVPLSDTARITRESAVGVDPGAGLPSPIRPLPGSCLRTLVPGVVLILACHRALLLAGSLYWIF